jgi:hypothetical protein
MKPRRLDRRRGDPPHPSCGSIDPANLGRAVIEEEAFNRSSKWCQARLADRDMASFVAIRSVARSHWCSDSYGRSFLDRSRAEGVVAATLTEENPERGAFRSDSCIRAATPLLPRN